jgi:hypothetical protein
MQYHLELNVVCPSLGNRTTKPDRSRTLAGQSRGSKGKQSLTHRTREEGQSCGGEIPLRPTDAVTTAAKSPQPSGPESSSRQLPTSQPHLLAQTHQAGHRVREKWLVGVAELSTNERWSKEKAEIEVRKAAAKAFFAHRIRTENSHSVVIAEGLLAACPEVRDHVQRLIRLRDDAWAADPILLRKAMHGPSQALVDIMRRQRRPHQMRHVSCVENYLAYLRQKISGRNKSCRP